MILVTGASGTVGSALVEALAGRTPVRRALREPGPSRADAVGESVPFDFERPHTYTPALDGARAVFLLRPPQMARAGDIDPFVTAMRAHGVERVVFLSVKGAGRNPLLPHHGIERRLLRAGLSATMLRANDLLQNFATVHARTIRETGEIRVPAGAGRASWIDARDVADVAAVALLDPTPGPRVHTLTGAEALGVADLAAAITGAIGRPVRYRPVSVPRFVRERRRAGAPLALALVMSGIYTVQRLGLAAEVTPDLPRLLGRPPRDLATFVRDYAQAWTP